LHSVEPVTLHAFVILRPFDPAELDIILHFDHFELDILHPLKWTWYAHSAL
jgi:hypothetical protein